MIVEIDLKFDATIDEMELLMKTKELLIFSVIFVLCESIMIEIDNTFSLSSHGPIEKDVNSSDKLIFISLSPMENYKQTKSINPELGGETRYAMVTLNQKLCSNKHCSKNEQVHIRNAFCKKRSKHQSAFQNSSADYCPDFSLCTIFLFFDQNKNTDEQKTIVDLLNKKIQPVSDTQDLYLKELKDIDIVF